MPKKTDKEKSLELGYLDRLIECGAIKIIENIETQPVKLGELLKMIELKRKLSPSDSEQSKLWKMLEKIRIEVAKKNQQKGESNSTKKVEQ